MKKNAVLIIDAQNDFCDPKGALYVDGADTDMHRLANWVNINKKAIDHISVTMDSHPVNDISHPSFWEDEQGNFPNPFTAISFEDIRRGDWRPRFFKEEAIQYIEELENQGEFAHFIWPYHCITGSRGAAIYDTLMDALIEWTHEGRFLNIIAKGTHPLTEHFGVFRANIPIDNQPETQLNQKLIDTLGEYQHIYLAGEAKSHCVANSLKQAMEEAPDLAQKFIILDDCMSNVTGYSHLGTPIYEEAKRRGIQFARSTEIVL